jgi:DNA modification methylase
MIETDHIYLMDCMKGMEQMETGSIDAVIADLPYGVLNRRNRHTEWDNTHPVGTSVGTIPENHQAGQPHHPVRARPLFRKAHAVAA